MSIQLCMELTVASNQLMARYGELATCILSEPVRDTPPYREIPFQDSIAEGVSHMLCLVFIGYRASIAEILLLWGGGIAPPLRMLSYGETLRKGRGGIAPNCPCSDTRYPIARNRGVSLRYSRGIAQ